MSTPADVLTAFTGYWNRLTLATKFNLLFCLVGIAGLLLGAYALDRAVTPAFDRIEQDDAYEQVARAKAKLGSELEFIQSSTTDYAFWDDSFTYLRNNNDHFANVIASPLAVSNAGINLLGYSRFDGQPRLVRYVDSGKTTQNAGRTERATEFVRSLAIMNRMHGQQLVSGFVRMGDRILAISIGQVKKSDATGTPEGYVMMGKELDPAALSAALQSPATVNLGTNLPPLMQMGDRAWKFAVPVAGLDGKILGHLDFSMPRDVSAQGRATVRGATITSALLLLGVLAAIYLAIGRIVVRRIRKIDSGVETVAGEGRLESMEHDPSHDEIGTLNHNFNRMVGQLKDLHEQIEAQSFKLGRDESMAGILHNVRNSLSPVSVIVGQILTDRANISQETIEKVLTELHSGSSDEGRRHKLVTYLAATFDQFEREDSARRDALSTARTSLSEAMEILKSRGNTSGRDIPLEPVDLIDIVNRNASVCRFAPWGEVAVELPDGSARVKANRLLLSQVVGNLMTNSVEAISRAARQPGHMKVTLSNGGDEAGDYFDLTLADDGCGFDPGDATRIFERGQTSKKGGSGGLGLHWCANTVRAMGGTLSLESEGEGQGAMARLRLRAA